MQPHDQLEFGPIDERIKEGHFQGSGIGEDVFRTGGLHLLDQQLTAGTGKGDGVCRHLAVGHHAALCGFEHRPRRRSGETGGHEAPEEPPPRDPSVEIVAQQSLHTTSLKRLIWVRLSHFLEERYDARHTVAPRPPAPG